MKDSDELPSLQDEEQDDAVIGRALKGSIWVFAGLLFIGGMVWVIQKWPEKKGPEVITEISVPTATQRAEATVPKVRFTDQTRQSGITFKHVNGAYGDKLLPETMGSGVAVLDYDQDGAPDLFFVNARYWDDHLPEGEVQPTHQLYRNLGNGQFEDVTDASGLAVSQYGMGVSVGDVNNDGWPDLFVSGVGGDRLFRNSAEGRFEDVTELAGVGGDVDGWSTCSAFFDADNDGDLDLFVGHYVQWSPKIDFEQGTTLTGIGRAYGQPMNFQGTFPSLYQNQGDGTFKDVSGECGIQIKNSATEVPVAKSLGVAPVDLNGDGLMDLIVANDTVQNFVFINQGGMVFKEVGARTGIGFDSFGKARGAMGIDTARFREDEAMGVGIANFANEMTALYVGRSENLIFTDEAIPAGIGPASRLALKFGLFFFDYDLDGWQDLLTANGHLEEEIHQIQESQQYEQSAHLFWNAGPDFGCRFLEVSSEDAGGDLFSPLVGRGSAFADFDGDGDLDVVMTQTNQEPLLLRNDFILGHHWVRLKLVGVRCNRDAIGAWVRAEIGEQVLWRQVMPTRSYLSQSEKVITIGLGRVDRIDHLTIQWPDGQRQVVDDLAIDKLHVILQEQKR